MKQQTLDFPLEIKEGSIDDKGVFEGYASTFGGEPDLQSDVIARGAFTNTLKKNGRNGMGVSMLWQHQPDLPIGVWLRLAEDDRGLAVQGKIDVEAKPNGIPVYSLMRQGAIRGLSIGYEAKSFDRNKSTGVRTLKEIALQEISPVTFPANINTTITNVKDMMMAKTPREFEDALRDAGLTRKQAGYVVSLCKDKLDLRDAGSDDADEALLAGLQEINKSMASFLEEQKTEPIDAMLEVNEAFAQMQAASKVGVVQEALMAELKDMTGSFRIFREKNFNS